LKIMQEIIQCLQLLYVPSFQISCKIDIRYKNYEQKITYPRSKGQKIGQVFLLITLSSRFSKNPAHRVGSIFKILTGEGWNL